MPSVSPAFTSASRVRPNNTSYKRILSPNPGVEPYRAASMAVDSWSCFIKRRSIVNHPYKVTTGPQIVQYYGDALTSRQNFPKSEYSSYTKMLKKRAVMAQFPVFAHAVGPQLQNICIASKSPITHLAEKRLSINFCDWSEVTDGLLWKTWKQRERDRGTIRQEQERERSSGILVSNKEVKIPMRCKSNQREVQHCVFASIVFFFLNVWTALHQLQSSLLRR